MQLSKDKSNDSFPSFARRMSPLVRGGVLLNKVSSSVKTPPLIDTRLPLSPATGIRVDVNTD